MKYNVLFICTGNTCRSPMAEGLLKHHTALERLDHIQITSAGTAAITGLTATNNAIRASAEHGIDISSHRSKPLTAGLVREADLILTMERQQAAFARELGAVWAGAAGDAPPRSLDAAIIFAPVGELVPEALKRLKKGGVVVCAGIHMSDIPAFPYADLWGERRICSVANLTREDGYRLLEIAPQVPVRTQVQVFDLADTAVALNALRDGRIQGAAVVRVAER